MAEEETKPLPLLEELITYKEGEDENVNIIQNEPEQSEPLQQEEDLIDTSYSRKRNFFSFYSKKKNVSERPRGHHGTTKRKEVKNINSNRLGLVHVGWDEEKDKEQLITKPTLEDINEDGSQTFLPKNYVNNSDIVVDTVCFFSYDNNKRRKKLLKKVTIDVPDKKEICYEAEQSSNSNNIDNDDKPYDFVICFIEEIIIEAKRQNSSLYQKKPNVPIPPAFPFKKIEEIDDIIPKKEIKPLDVSIPITKTYNKKNTFNLSQITPEKAAVYSNTEVSTEEEKNKSRDNEMSTTTPIKIVKENTSTRGSNGKTEQQLIDMLTPNNEKQKYNTKMAVSNKGYNYSSIRNTESSNKRQIIDDEEDWDIDIKSKILNKKVNESKKAKDRYVLVSGSKNKIKIEKVNPNKPSTVLFHNISDSDTLNRLKNAKANYMKNNQVKTYKKIIRSLVDELLKPKSNTKTRMFEIMPTLINLKEKIDFLVSNEKKIPPKKCVFPKLKSYLFLLKQLKLTPQTIYGEKIIENTFENDIDDIIDSKKFVYDYFDDYPKAKLFLHYLVIRIDYLYEESRSK